MAFWRKKKKETDSAQTTEPENVALENDDTTDDSDSPNVATSDQPADAVTVKKKKGLFGLLKRGMKKTVDVLNTDIRDLVGKEGRLVDEEFLKELFAHLVKTDMGAGPAGEIRDRIKKDFRGRKVHMTELIDSAKVTIHEIMQQPEQPIARAESGTTVVMVVGVNGSGKNDFDRKVDQDV